MNKLLFEDLLDNIDIADEESVITNIVKANTNPKYNYNYVLYIFCSVENENDIKHSLTEPFQLLKQRFNAYLDSYWTDEIIYSPNEYYCQEYSDLVKPLPEDEEDNVGYVSICYRIYFNFDKNINHILKFFSSFPSTLNVCIFNNKTSLQLQNDIINFFNFLKSELNKNLQKTINVPIEDVYSISLLLETIYIGENALETILTMNGIDSFPYIASIVQKTIKNMLKLSKKNIELIIE